MTEAVNHPKHYGGEDNPLEVIKIINHYGLNFELGNVLKYVLRADKKGNRKQTTILLLFTLFLGITFIVLQFKGFGQVIENGYFFTGSESNVTTSFLYITVLVHIAHLLGGIISLLVVIYNHYKQKYNSAQTLGIELSAMYWHFMDFIWVYLFLFFYFFNLHIFFIKFNPILQPIPHEFI